MIDLYTSGTPNGHKASVTLEELEHPYEVHAINLSAGDQKTPEWLAGENEKKFVKGAQSILQK